MGSIHPNESEFSTTPKEALALLRRQSDLYEQLEALSQRQRPLVSEENVGPLLTLLADRNRLSIDLNRIEGELAPLRSAWSSYTQRFTHWERDESRRLLDGIRTRIERVLQRDEVDARILSARKQSVSQALSSTRETRQVIAAYTPAAPVSRGVDFAEGA